MNATLVDTQGRAYRLKAAEGAERGSYGALFSRASTYRAQRLLPQRTEGISRPAKGKTSKSCAESWERDVLVTYIPLTTSLQESASTSEAVSLQLVLQNVRLRRQVDHPYLRTLMDAFYTDQTLSSPRPASDGADHVGVEKRADASPETEKCRKRKGATPGSGGTQLVTDTAALTGISSPTITALVVVEDYTEGCSLSDYATAVAKRLLFQGHSKMLQNMAVISYQLAQVLLHLHAVGHVVCRDIPLDSVRLDINKGCVRFRLPLSAAAMLDMAEGSAGSCQATVLTLPHLMPEDDSPSGVAGEGRKVVCAPEVSNMSCWGESPAAPGGALPLSADVWALGLLMLQLGSLNHVDFSAATSAAERLAVIRSHLHHLAALLPPEAGEDMVRLISDCLALSPARRPTLQALLQSRAFAKYHFSTAAQRNDAAIHLAEAVRAVYQKEPSPPSMEPTAQLSRKRDAAGICLPNMTVEGFLMSLSLEDLSWETPQCFRDTFVPVVEPPAQTRNPSAPPSDSASPKLTTGGTTPVFEGPPPSLAIATKQALQDVALLHDQYRALDAAATPISSPTTSSAHQSVWAAWRERVRHTRQLPHDVTSTKTTMEELAEHFAKLEHAEPRLCFRFIELLMEGLENCPSDVTAVTDSVVLAEALQHTSATDTAGASDAPLVRDDSSVDEMIPHVAPMQKVTVFNVAETVRVMPSMPAHMISSDRAANTSAVLYNSWLRKQQKKHLKMAEY
ncbi:hypothetical protein LSCM1_01045 [Leishmania martiniquensis]|uniref:Protein kinase domain-containing protein n=1 Tax=Leishmania martiniquensis TaxID=1580590 RepID=A0A836KIH5_9TRYP|nr:hypothetical protein LSCM1_01045 [Leishmania martiniquensis]